MLSRWKRHGSDAEITTDHARFGQVPGCGAHLGQRLVPAPASKSNRLKALCARVSRNVVLCWSANCRVRGGALQRVVLQYLTYAFAAGLTHLSRILQIAPPY
jgi:hypothetical protein